MRSRVSVYLAAGVALTAMALGSASAQTVPSSETAAPGVSVGKGAAADAAPDRKSRRAARRRTLADKQAHKAGETAGPERNDIVVVGLRGSLASSRNKKRNAKQIVDSVSAEDAGKLPDNNVPEALARVTGVAIDRVHGEGQNITIRGLSDIQTTINGNDVGGVARSGTGVEAGITPSRSLTLADIPAELLKSVDVYKTRTADQIEGGIAGTVNVELRRPLDLKKGWTVAGSFRGVHSDIGNKWSPYGSLLAGYHFDTGIGEMGFLINASLEKNKYEEDYIFDESPQLVPVGSTSYKSLPADLATTLAIPYRVTYGVDTGEVTKPAINASYQWKPSDKLEFVLEGSWFGSRENAYSNMLRLVTNDGNENYSNVVLSPQGAIKSLTMTNANGIAGGPESEYSRIVSNTYNANFEANWHSDKVKIHAKVQYNQTKARFRRTDIQGRFANGTTANLDFDSNQIPGGGPFVQFVGVDYADPSQYTIGQIHDEYGSSENKALTGQLDFTVDTSDTGFFRSFQFGGRASSTKDNYYTGYRDGAFPTLGEQPTIGSIPGGILQTTTPDIPGVNSPTWYHLDPRAIQNDWAETRAYLMSLDPVMYDGGTYATDLPSADNYNDSSSKEYTWAAYAQFSYGFKAIFPIDGVIGARVTNTWGSSRGTNSHSGYDVNGNVVQQFTPAYARANYLDFLPNANAIIHFEKNLQLRLSYTWNVQRPSFANLSPQISYDATQINVPTSYVYSGNPDLKPTRERNYDASLEYYFGRAGQISVDAFLKTQKGFVYYQLGTTPVPVAALGGSVHYLGRPENAGPGKVQGFEFAAQSFFDFLPGIWKNFGINANLTYIPTATLHLLDYGVGTAGVNIPDEYLAPYTSKYTYNVALYYDTPKLSARVAWNYRSKYKNDINPYSALWQVFTKPTSRLDAAINYTPVKFITFSIEGTNLLRNYQNQYYGAIAGLPVGARVQARTVQLGARFRF